MGERQTRTKLIDFLYKDKARIDSYVAQLFSGKLTSIEKANISEDTKGKALGLSAKVVSGERSTSNRVIDDVTRSYDPHDSLILELLEHLSGTVPADSIAQLKSGQIALVYGNIALRDYEILTKLLPIAFEGGLLDPRSFGQAIGSKETDRKKLAKTMIAMFEFAIGGVELEIMLENGEVISGQLKPEYLCSTPRDLWRAFGTYFPDKWFVLGIVDHSIDTAAYIPTGSLQSAADQTASALRYLCRRDDISGNIIPIVIYRELTY